MFKLSLPCVVIVALLVLALPAGTVAASSEDAGDISSEDVAAMVAELADEDNYSPELCFIYKEYKNQRIDTVSYTVKKGDTLISIAETYQVSVATISESNDIANPHLIFPGQELVFPAVSGLLYTVQEGDKLASLAKKYKVDIETIWSANALDSETMVPGLKLVLPGASLPAPPAYKKTVSRASVSRSVNLANVKVPGFIWPVQGRVSSGFGMRGSFFHGGIDITGKYGTPIGAAASGTVTACGWRGSYGYMIEIQHNSQVATLYAHASKLLVSEGEEVTQGQVIAYVGSTGYSTGPHLHFELKIKGDRVNPRSYLP